MKTTENGKTFYLEISQKYSLNSRVHRWSNSFSTVHNIEINPIYQSEFLS